MRREFPLALLALGTLITVLTTVLIAALLTAAGAVSLSQIARISRAGKQLVEVGWTKAPYTVQPLPIECLGNGVLVYPAPNAPPQFYPLVALQAEAATLRDLLSQGANRLSLQMSRSGQGGLLGNVLESDSRLRNSFVLAMRKMDASNRERRARGEPLRQPIVLVRPSGVGTYEPVVYLLETATRLQVGTEPMLPTWLFAGAMR